MNNIKRTPEINRILQKILGKYPIMTHNFYYGLRALSKKDFNIIYDFLLSSTQEDFNSIKDDILFKNKIEQYSAHCLKQLSCSIKDRKKHMALDEKNKKIRKERLAAEKKRQAEFKKQTIENSKNIFSALKLTQEQKEILKKIVEAK